MKVRLLPVLLLVAIAACAQQAAPPQSSPAAIPSEEVTLPSGTTHLVTDAGPFIDYDDHLDDDQVALVRGSGDRTTFAGNSRKAAKLSISTGKGVSFSDVCKFLAALPSDTTMRALHISRKATSGRVQQEEFNAQFSAYILASSFPADNDYHVILGDHSTKPTCLLNVEVSGLPSSGSDPSYSTLSAVRSAYKTGMGKALPSGGYKKYSPGIPVSVTGSGFFDVSHSSGTIGPLGLRPATAWELHPVTSISFLSQ